MEETWFPLKKLTNDDSKRIYMKNSAKNSNLGVFVIAFSMSILLILILVILYEFGTSSHKTAINIVGDEMRTKAEGFSSQVYKDLNNMTQMGIAFRDMIVALPIDKQTDALPLVGTLCANSEAYMVVYCDADGSGVTQNSIKVNVSEDNLIRPNAGNTPYYAYIQKERIMQAEAVVSVIPVVREGNDTNYILMYYSVSRIRKLFHQNTSFDNAYLIFSVDQGIVITTEGMNKQPEQGSTITQVLKDLSVDTNIKQMQIAMDANESISTFTSSVYNKYIICTPVGINDWYITIGFDKNLYDTMLTKEWGSISKLIQYLLALIITFVIILVAIILIMRIIYRRTNKKLQKQANMDLLTGLYNKISTESRIKQYIDDHLDSGAILYILDVDDFKTINDTWGHAEGDAVLIRLGSFLKEAFGGNYVVGRIGGDEFIIFVKNIVTEQEVEEQLQQMRKSIMELSRYVGKTHPCTFSLGASFYPKDAQDFESLYKAADKALYEAKKNGKDQLMLTKN
jgi:diguanylate cyclase (GGDEF)-like protein